VASKEIGLAVNADKIRYMVMFRDQYAGQSHCKNFDNNSLERVEKFKYLETTLTHQNSIQEETESKHVGKWLISFSAVFFLPVCYPKIERLRYTKI
jgi:hypothetical protein